jgi:hypothetical protein
MEAVRVSKVTIVAIPTMSPIVRKAIFALRLLRLFMEMVRSFMQFPRRSY